MSPLGHSDPTATILRTAGTLQSCRRKPSAQGGAKSPISVAWVEPSHECVDIWISGFPVFASRLEDRHHAQQFDWSVRAEAVTTPLRGPHFHLLAEVFAIDVVAFREQNQVRWNVVIAGQAQKLTAFFFREPIFLNLIVAAVESGGRHAILAIHQLDLYARSHLNLRACPPAMTRHILRVGFAEAAD